MIRIGGGSGYWGESDMGLPQLLAEPDLDFVVFDYLAEITMSIMARAHAKDASLGYATDFVHSVIGKNLPEIAETGAKLLSNAGGVNPEKCAEAVRAKIAEAGLNLSVAAVTGDNLTQRAGDFANAREMFSGEGFPAADRIASINAYLGAFAIAEALNAGADIVITGRCADSALALAACIHSFGWKRDDWDKLSAGSLAGHLIECGPQASGGNFTDWEEVEDSLVDAGYPIAMVEADGTMVLTKPRGTGGAVTVGTVAEQLVYEIGDPQAYLLPDVTCDFSNVTLDQIALDQVRVAGATGRPAPASYKTSATFRDGYRIQTLWYFIGRDASAKARSFAKSAFKRANRKLAASGFDEYTETSIEAVGDDTHFGAFADAQDTRELAIKIAARHPDPKALTILLKEASGLALAAPPGLALYTGGRPSPSQVVRLFSFLVPKQDVPISIELDGKSLVYSENPVTIEASQPDAIDEPALPQSAGDMTTVLLRDLAYGRSGDKGNNANIGLIPRAKLFAPWIWHAVTTQVVEERFAHFLEGRVERFYMPGTGAMNLLLHDVLGGGGMASLRCDPQGKSYAQILLDMPVSIPRKLLREASLA